MAMSPEERRARYRERMRRWRAANPEESRARVKRYQDAHREEVRARYRRWRVSNLERERANKRRWRAENNARFRETANRQSRLWARRNPEKARLYTRRWFAKNAERRRAYNRAYYSANKDKKRRWNLQSQNRLTAEEWRRIAEKAVTASERSFKEKPKKRNQAKMLDFVKRWRNIEARRKELDYEESKWCADLRREFPSGKVGDKAFCDWLSVELGLPAERHQELLARATAHEIVPDNAQWSELGGYTQIRALVPLDKKERVAVIGAAKASGYRVSTIVRQRQQKASGPPRTPDIVLLAEFVESLHAVEVPPDVRAVARKYARARALRVDHHARNFSSRPGYVRTLRPT